MGASTRGGAGEVADPRLPDAKAGIYVESVGPRAVLTLAQAGLRVLFPVRPARHVVAGNRAARTRS